MDTFLKNMIRVGRVTKYHPDPAKHLARVIFEDKQDTESFWMPMIVRNTLQNKDYWMPDKGELVVCLFMPNGNAQGFILGSIYQDKDASSVISEDRRNVRCIEFNDGTYIEYDRETHILKIDMTDSGGKIVINGQVIVNGAEL